jgi:putative acetyltransferase
MTITIRRARIDDAGVLARLMGDPAVFPGLMQMPFASEEAQRARLAESLAPGKADVLLVAERGGEVVGSSGMHPAGASPRRRHAMVIGISVHAQAQGQGVGSALMQAMCDVADRWIGLLRLELTVYVDNERAIGFYKKLGARPMDDWTVYRVTGDALLALARGPTEEIR